MYVLQLITNLILPYYSIYPYYSYFKKLLITTNNNMNVEKLINHFFLNFY